MKFYEAAEFLFDLRRFDPRPGTEATAALLSHLDDPHADLACVQVAGSNGKGSTARMVESTLREAGLTVGLYTSPHLEDIRERIRVDGQKLSETALVSFVEATREYVVGRATDGEAPTFFETLTALALWEFGRQDVDVAVLEVGIGGTHDATSVVDPVASAVTTVALEHTDVLGEDVETIARDKAGVAPADRPLVTAATGPARAAIGKVVADVVDVRWAGAAEEAEEGEEGEEGEKSGEGNDAEQVPGDVSVTYGGRDGFEGTAEITGKDWAVGANLALLGSHQARNAGVAAVLSRQVGDELGHPVGTADIERGLRNAHWPGRFEAVQQDPLVVLDGAHNPAGCESVADTLADVDFDDLHLVVGALTDKDHRGMAAAFADATSVVACEPAHDRAEDKAVLARAFAEASDAAISTRSDVAGALDDVLAAATADDCVLVVGSLYTVGEARRRWTRTQVPKRVDSIRSARQVLESANVTPAGTWRMRGKAVHRVIQTRVQPRQAQYLKEEMLSLGGECALSGLSGQDEESIQVVLMGTMAQFRRLCGKLDGQPFGLAVLADQFRASLDIGDGSEDGVGGDQATPGAESDGQDSLSPGPGSTRPYPWEDGTAVMGILNVTPDSFHDGGQFETTEAAVSRAREMVAAGADIVDVGGESTRPGADPVSVDAETERVVPVVAALEDLDALVSVDTRKAGVARAALSTGADMVNDVSGLADPEMRHVVAEYDVPLVVMHSIDAPVDPDSEVHYDDVVADVIDDLRERVFLAEKAGLDRSQILVDPGLGFGKTAAESFAALDRLGEFGGISCPVLVGHSHKSMFEAVDRGPDERTEATVAATALAAERGADVVRVHDVAANATAVDVVETAANSRSSGDG